MKSSTRNIIFFLLIALFFVIGATAIINGNSAKDDIAYSDIIALFQEKRVESVVIDEAAEVTLVYQKADNQGNLLYNSDGSWKTGTLTYKITFDNQLETIDRLALEAYERGELKTYNYLEPHETSWFITYLPYILFFGVIIVLFVVMMGQARKGGPAGNFARAKTKTASNEKNTVRFADVAGADEEKQELEEVVEFLRNPQKFTRLGARIPRGVLLVGPPGTGKTLLAKAVAGEAGVPFYSISGSDFVEMYVGVGASRVRDLFETARKTPASIIFIDEIDAVGRHRGAGLGGGHDEREQTLNQLLVEMDGFGGHEGVIVMAATNRPDILDPALLRPGRFDRQITVNYPDLKGREDILRVHIKNKPLGDDVDLHKIAQTTVGFTGADLANLLNEAALLTARRGKALIGMTEIEESTLKILVGTEKKNKVMDERDRKNTAYHEAGHAVLAHLIPGLDPVTRISIIPSSKGALGYTLTPPQVDQYSEYRKVMIGQISMTL
ncbi:MAG: ATP-dependent zinc metalloprotease FtsH, partial [Clostridia bacterium]|nr:ATP-dependent zinc metalloprotease FtsH [Clostridia bacterium]